ncbi:MAG: hypothetical protein QY309_11360 [Cyclobacteriaceae bacterium]|nr:MAG: hypothetical protein QY309_11360 [Cyclobacteriaceae bacterium]
MSRIFPIVLFFLWVLHAVAQVPFDVKLSQKHLAKIEQAKSGKNKLRLYRKFFKEDSLQQAKAYETQLQKHYDSLLASNGLERLALDSARIDSLIKQNMEEMLLDTAEIRNRAEAVIRSSGIGDGVEKVSGYKDQLRDFDEDSLKSGVISMFNEKALEKVSSIEQIQDLKDIQAQKESLDPWRNDHVSINQLQDTAFIKNLARKEAEELALEYLSEHSELLDPIQKNMDRLMKKFSVVPNSNDLGSAIKRSSLKGKGIRERLFLSLNSQVISIEPVSVDISPMVGYKFTSKFILGFGGLYRQTFSQNQVSFAPDVFGYKGFMSYEPLNKLFAYTEYARNSPGVNRSETGAQRIWKDAWLIGAGRRFEVHPKLDMTILIAYNVLKNINDPVYPGRWNVRIGFQLSELGLKKIRNR